MKTYTFCVENSDNKLTQLLWSLYCSAISRVITDYSDIVYFVGHSNPCSSFQNACFVASFKPDRYKIAKTILTEIRQKYNQGSDIIVVEGASEFI